MGNIDGAAESYYKKMMGQESIVLIRLLPYGQIWQLKNGRWEKRNELPGSDE
jgi:hypothetical protein